MSRFENLAKASLSSFKGICWDFLKKIWRITTRFFVSGAQKSLRLSRPRIRNSQSGVPDSFFTVGNNGGQTKFLEILELAENFSFLFGGKFCQKLGNRGQAAGMSEEF